MIRKDFLPLARPSIAEDDITAAIEVLQSGWWTTGPKVTEFENAVAEYLCNEEKLYTAALNSCTSGLHLSLNALQVGKGDEVIVPTWTFAATAQVVEWVGAKLVLCDIEESTLSIDLTKAERLISPRTKAIIPVHIAGYPCNMHALKEFADKHKLSVIEDAAHAFGTRYKGRKIGDFSDVTVFSFYATKNLAMGEGGVVVAKNEELIEKIRKLGYFGINKKAFQRYDKCGNWFYDIEELGFKYNLDSVHAAIGISQLKRLDKMNERRREIAAQYKARLTKRLSFFEDRDEHYHTYHLFMIKLPAEIERNSFIEALKENNIGASVHFIPLHLHSYYRGAFSGNDFPVANAVFNRIVSIPMFPSMTDADVDYVIGHINDIVGE
ncbi:MAG: DegT/DnrJ/EryC1/StrS family aminotransferase [Nitrospirota bacterium]